MSKTDSNGHCQPHRVRLPLPYEEMLEKVAEETGLSLDRQAAFLIMECLERRVQDLRRKQVELAIKEYEEDFDLRHIRKSILSKGPMAF